MELDRRFLGLRARTINRLVAAAALAFYAAIPLVSPNFRLEHEPPGNLYGGDFLAEWIGGYILVHGDRSRLYDRDYADRLQHDPELVGFVWSERAHLQVLYPPCYYLLVSPFSLLPVWLSALVWYALMGLFFAGSVWLLARAFPEQALLVSVVLPAGLLFGPMLFNVTSGQKGTVWLFVLTATYLLLAHGRPFRAGLVFGILGLKPQLALVIGLALLAWRQGWFVLGSAVTVAVWVGLSLLVGLDACRGFVELVLAGPGYAQQAGYPIWQGQSWVAFFQRLLHPAAAPETIRALVLLADLLTLAAVVALCWRPFRFDAAGFALQWSGLILATVLVNPHMLIYDLTIVLLPLFLLGRLSVLPSPALALAPWLWRYWLWLWYTVLTVSSLLASRLPVPASVLVNGGTLVLLLLAHVRGAAEGRRGGNPASGA